ncbi:energy transducer TonB [Variovorax paradoxus]|uniref:IgA FC receptor n=1 Tax=Variovorax paradoxus TaxID=34073 RepID=A0A0H2M9T6_VARPD|nr:energy transducer TonB [Variovorax paradoxus]KLN57412.1 IgA FC receptor precursor [Variovorax paradoxus]
MDYNFQSRPGGNRFTGLAFVVLLHIAIGYLLLSGLARKAVDIIKKPMEAVVIQEVTLPPPPPPPPPPQKIVRPPKPQAPKVQAPPPKPFVPPPEISPPPAAAPAIASTPTPPPAPVEIAPPPPPAPVPAPAAKADLGVACPTQVKPEIPAKALQDGISGVVRAQATIQGGAIGDVQILSGPRIFHAAVRSALRQYKCTAADGTVATQDFAFKVE